METRAHYVAVGAFVLTIIILAFVAVIWLAQFQFSQQYAHYEIIFTGPVTGLSEGAPVQYNGIRVGRVTSIGIPRNNVEQIRVMTEIESGIVIKTDAIAELETNILSGVSFIQIRGGTREAPVLVAERGQNYPIIASRRAPLEQAFARAPQLLERLIEVTDSLNDLLNDHNRKMVAQTLDNVDVATGAIAAHAKDLGDTVAGADATVRELDKLLTNIDQSYSSQGGLKDQASAALTQFDRLAQELRDSNRQLQAVLHDARPGVRTFSQRTLAQVDALVGETRQLVAGLSRLAAQIERDPTRFIFGDRREGYRPR